MIEKEHVCYQYSFKTISGEDVQKLFGNIQEKGKKIGAFVSRERKTAQIIPAEELGKHNVAFFQECRTPEDFYPEYNLMDILVDFEVDYEEKTVKAKKLFRYQGKYEMQERTYFLENYGNTWRAWTAIPKKAKAHPSKWIWR